MSYEKYNGWNLDIGHFLAANSISPVPFLQKYHDRITHLHLKDRKKNMGPNLPWGQGETPIVECLQLIRDKKWNIPGIIEMEHTIPQGSDNWIELGKCIEFCKKALPGDMEVIRQLYGGRSFLTDHVYMEILRGIRSGRDDLSQIHDAIADGWLRKTCLQTSGEKEKFEKPTESLGLGEASCIAAAQSRGLVFASDDLAARREAERQGILLTGMLGILMRAVSQTIIDARETNQILKNMIKGGFFSRDVNLRTLLKPICQSIRPGKLAQGLPKTNGK